MPLHRGHQLLIETALANVDQLTVVVYDTVVDNDTARLMPIEKRTKWISDLYPQITDIVSQRDIFEDSEIDYKERDDGKYSQMYADDLAYLGQFTHVFSSELYGLPFATALGAEHILVDQARNMMPISGTMLRENLYKYRAYVDPLVYRSLIQKIVFVGTESTGKSTLSARMAEEFDTMHTSEFGRTLWVQKMEQGITPDFHDLLVVGQTQYQQEQAAVLHSNRYLFCDTNAWTTMMWSEMYHGTADARLRELAYKTKDEYIWILCDNNFDWVQDGYRELLDGKASTFQSDHVKRLARDGIEVELVTGGLDARVAQVKNILSYYENPERNVSEPLVR